MYVKLATFIICCVSTCLPFILQIHFEEYDRYTVVPFKKFTVCQNALVRFTLLNKNEKLSVIFFPICFHFSWFLPFLLACFNTKLVLKQLSTLFRVFGHVLNLTLCNSELQRVDNKKPQHHLREEQTMKDILESTTMFHNNQPPQVYPLF